MKTFEKVFDIVCNIVEKFLFYFVSILIVTISAIVCAEIIARNLFNHSFVIVEELSMIMLAWIAAFSCGYAVRRRAHVSVDALYAKFPKQVKYALYTITYVGMLIFMIYIVDASFGFAKMQMKIPLTQSRIPRGVISYGLPYGGIFTVFFLAADLVETLILKRDRSIRTSIEVTEEEIENAEIDEDALRAMKNEEVAK